MIDLRADETETRSEFVARVNPNATPAALARVNWTTILELLRDRGPLTRQGIVDMSGLSPATVNRLVKGLLRAGVVRPSGQGKSSGGRPPVVLRFDGEGECVVVLDVGGTKIAGAVVDSDGAFVYREVRPTVYENDGSDLASATLERSLQFAADLMNIAVKKVGVPRAIAIGVPGIVLHGEGMVEWAPALNWRRLPLRALVQQRVGLPVLIENDVNLMALGEHRRGAGRGTRHMVVLALGTGLGAGLILDGHLYRGWNDAAGEVGSLLAERSSLDRPYPQFGDLEMRVGAEGIVRQARARSIQGQNGPLTAKDVFEAARHGDLVATDVLADIADDLALAVANVATLLAPELVVLGGGIGRSADLLIPRIHDRLVGRVPCVPRIEAAALGGDGPLVGAALYAIEATAGFLYLTNRSGLSS